MKMSKKSGDKYEKLLKKLIGETKIDNFNKTTKKIKEEILNTPHEKRDYNILLNNFKKRHIKYYIEMLLFLIESNAIDERTKRQFRYKYVNAVLELQGDDNYKANCIMTEFLQIEMIELYKDNRLINAALFDCLPIIQSEEFFSSVYLLLTQTQPKSVMLLDFIAEAMVTVALTHSGQLNDFYSLFKIFDYYINEACCWLPLKKIIIGLLCLECSKMKQDDIEIIWVTIKKILSFDAVGTFRILIGILSHFYPQSSFALFREFSRYNFYSSIELNHKSRENKAYATYLANFKTIIRKDYLEEQRIAIQEGAFLLIEKILCENDRNIDKIFIHLPFGIMLDKLTLFALSPDKSLSRAYLHLLLVIVNKYGDQVTDRIPYIIESIDVMLRINNIDAEKDKEICRKIKDFHNTLFQLIISKKVSLALLVTQSRIGTTLKNTRIITESFLFINAIYSFEQNFDLNCDKVFEQNVLKYDFPRFQCYILDLLIYNVHHNRKRAEVIEKVVFHNLIKSFKTFIKDKCVQRRFIELLTDIMARTPNMSFFVSLFDMLLETNESVIDIQKQSLVMLLEKLNKQYDHSKLKIVDSILLNKDIFFHPYSQAVILSALNKMVITRKYEVFFNETSDINEAHYTSSQIKLIDPINNSNGDNSNENDSYFLLNYIKIVDFLIENLKSPDVLNDRQYERIYETIALYAKKCFLLRKVDMVSLIDILLKNLDDAIKKNNMIAFGLILDTFVYIAYHLKHNLTEEAISHSGNEDDILLITDLKIKEKIINTLTKMYFDLVDSIRKGGKKGNVISKSKSQKETLASNLGTSTTSNNSNNNSQLSNSQSYNRSSKEPPHNQKTITPEELGLDIESKSKLKKITQILQVLHLYLNSITTYFNRYKQASILSSSSINTSNTKLEKKKYGSEFLQITIRKLLKAIINSLWIISYKQKYIISLLHFIIGIRELLFHYEDKTILRIIVISIALGWSREEGALFNQLELFFNITESKRINPDFMSNFNLKTDAKKLQYEYIKYLSDTLALYFIEQFGPCALLFKVIQEILVKCSQPLRQHVFFELIKWHLLSRKQRSSNILNKTEGFDANDSLLFVSDDSIIMLTPISINTTNMIIRNIISNANLSISSNTDIVDQSKSVQLLKKLINNDMISDKENIMFNAEDNKSNNNNEKPDDKKCNCNVNDDMSNDNIKINKVLNEKTRAKNNAIETFQKLMHYTCVEFDQFQYIENVNSEINKMITKIDEIPVYTSFVCSIIYAKGNYLTDEYDLLSYQGESSEEYVNFLNSLGQLYNINDNPQLDIINLNSKLCHYVISFQDSFFNLLFQVSNLIEINQSDSNIVYESRKSVIDSNYLNIIWMNNPTKTFKPSIIKRKTTEPYVYIIVSPIAQTHYLINTIWCPCTDETKKGCIEKVQSLFLSEFVLNIHDKCSVMFFIQFIIQLNMIKEYLLIDIKLKENKTLNVINDILKQGLSNNYVERASEIQAIIFEMKNK